MQVGGRFGNHFAIYDDLNDDPDARGRVRRGVAYAPRMGISLTVKFRLFGNGIAFVFFLLRVRSLLRSRTL